MRRYQWGFTIIELMVALVVMAVVVAIAIPSFNTQIQNNRSAGLGEELVAAINYARSEAVKRGRRVSLCGSEAGLACDGSWADGMIVFVDAADSDTAAPEVEEINILRVWDDFGAGTNITEANDKSFIRYTANGTLARVDANAISIDVNVKGCRGEAGRTISISLAGMVSVARANCPESDDE